MTMRIVQPCFVAALLLSAMLSAEAQTTTGSILGEVTDSSGTNLTGVTVRVTSPGTGATRQTQTSAGTYQFAGLPPAEYVVTARIAGISGR